MSKQLLIHFTLATSSIVEVYLTDVTGRRIKTIAEGNFAAGEHEAILQKGNLRAGLYLVQLKTNTTTSVNKILIL